MEETLAVVAQSIARSAPMTPAQYRLQGVKIAGEVSTSMDSVAAQADNARVLAGVAKSARR
jgi:hypothetical protein